MAGGRNGKIKRATFGKNRANSAGAGVICRREGALFSGEPGRNKLLDL